MIKRKHQIQKAVKSKLQKHDKFAKKLIKDYKIVPKSNNNRNHAFQHHNLVENNNPEATRHLNKRKK
jgi:hypothetical protein